RRRRATEEIAFARFRGARPPETRTSAGASRGRDGERAPVEHHRLPREAARVVAGEERSRGEGFVGRAQAGGGGDASHEGGGGPSGLAQGADGRVAVAFGEAAAVG